MASPSGGLAAGCQTTEPAPPQLFILDVTIFDVQTLAFIPAMTSTRLITAAASLLALSSAMADVKLAPLFTDNMMLQRDKPVRIWGTADAAEAVSVTLAGKTAATKADAAGAWIVELPALSEAQQLKLKQLTVR